MVLIACRARTMVLVLGGGPKAHARNAIALDEDRELAPAPCVLDEHEVAADRAGELHRQAREPLLPDRGELGEVMAKLLLGDRKRDARVVALLEAPLEAL